MIVHYKLSHFVGWSTTVYSRRTSLSWSTVTATSHTCSPSSTSRACSPTSSTSCASPAHSVTSFASSCCRMRRAWRKSPGCSPFPVKAGSFYITFSLIILVFLSLSSYVWRHRWRGRECGVRGLVVVGLPSLRNSLRHRRVVCLLEHLSRFRSQLELDNRCDSLQNYPLHALGSFHVRFFCSLFSSCGEYSSRQNAERLAPLASHSQLPLVDLGARGSPCLERNSLWRQRVPRRSIGLPVARRYKQSKYSTIMKVRFWSDLTVVYFAESGDIFEVTTGDVLCRALVSAFDVVQNKSMERHSVVKLSVYSALRSLLAVSVAAKIAALKGS